MIGPWKLDKVICISLIGSKLENSKSIGEKTRPRDFYFYILVYITGTGTGSESFNFTWEFNMDHVGWSNDHKMTRNSSGDSCHDKRCVLIAQQLSLQWNARTVIFAMTWKTIDIAHMILAISYWRQATVNFQFARPRQAQFLKIKFENLFRLWFDWLRFTSPLRNNCVILLVISSQTKLRFYWKKNLNSIAFESIT